MKSRETESQRTEAVQLARQFFKNVRTHPEAKVPVAAGAGSAVKPRRQAVPGTVMTGEMFAPILGEQIERYNRLRGRV